MRLCACERPFSWKKKTKRVSVSRVWNRGMYLPHALSISPVRWQSQTRHHHHAQHLCPTLHCLMRWVGCAQALSMTPRQFLVAARRGMSVHGLLMFLRAFTVVAWSTIRRLGQSDCSIPQAWNTLRRLGQSDGSPVCPASGLSVPVILPNGRYGLLQFTTDG